MKKLLKIYFNMSSLEQKLVDKLIGVIITAIVILIVAICQIEK